MSQNDFGGNPYYPKAEGGGGYLAGGSPYGSASGSPGGSGRRSEQHSLRPLTIGQITRASQAHTDAEWLVDDVEVGQITVVGQITSIQRQATNTVYGIEDGSGRIEARHWHNSAFAADGEDQWGDIFDNVYVRVTGGLKMFGSKRYINVTHLRRAKPMEEYFHTLEAIMVNVIIQRGPPSAGGNKLAHGAAAGATNASVYTTQQQSTMHDEYASLPPVQRTIINFMLSQPENHEGIHVAAIARAVGGDAHTISASDALDKLMDHGHVFSTIDDSHFTVSR